MIQKVQSLNVEGLTEVENKQLETHVLTTIQSWEGTPYVPGQQCKGVAVDCVRFVSGVLDKIMGKTVKLPRLPQDASFHNPELTKKWLRIFLKHYPSTVVKNGIVEPGDVIIMGPRNGGPGHAAIIGAKGYWHCGTYGVCMGGLSVSGDGVYNFRQVRRSIERKEWFNRSFGGQV